MKIFLPQRGFTIVLCAVVLGGLAFSGFNSPTSAAKPITLVIGTPADPRMINPMAGSTFHDYVVGNQVFNSLIQADVDFNPVGDLAESWDVSPDKLTYTFNLAKNAKFHDGTPVTSEDVKFSLLKMNFAHSSVAVRGLAKVVDRIETPDAHTVVFHLSKPYPEMVNPYDGVGPHAGGVSPKHLYEGTDYTTNPHNMNPIGSGPFKFVEWVKGSHVILESYDKYFRGKPAIDRIVFRIMPDPTSMALAFEKGEVQYVPFWFPVSEVKRLNAMPENVVYTLAAPNVSTDVLAFNLRKEPFKKSQVRRAIQMAINKQNIANLVYHGVGAVPSTTPIGEAVYTSWWRNPDANLPEYNSDLANQLLNEAGCSKDASGWRFKMTIKHSTSYPAHRKVAELIKDDLKSVGIDVEIVSLDHAAWHEHTFARWDFDTSIVSKSHGPNPPTLFFYHTDNILRVSWTNCMGYSNGEFDQLYNRMLSQVDVTKRREDLYRMQKIMAEDQPVAWLVVKYFATAVKKNWFDANPNKTFWHLYIWKHYDVIKPPSQ